MKSEKSMSNVSLSLLWFGAAISIAEIVVGAYIAPLGLENGVFAIILGHLIGTAILFMAGYIGAKSRLSAIESTRISFGKFGSYLFSVLNVLQLLGWTAIMIISGAKALDKVTENLFGFQNEMLMSLLIGVLICLWIMIGIKNLDKVNIFAVGSLFFVTILLSFTVFKGSSLAQTAVQGSMSFGAAVELGVIMPLSWLPLIADYTRYSKTAKTGPLTSAICYFIGSCWMYAIGLGAALYTGTSDIAEILMAAGMGIAALIIVILSTVTTTFLDVYSAAESFLNIRKKTNGKAAALVFCILGVMIAIFTPIEQYENFLYLIGSAFAPMFAILMTEYFLFKKTNIDNNNLFNYKNIILWVVGVAIYRSFMQIDSPVGSSLPVLIIISLLYIVINGGNIYVSEYQRKRSSKKSLGA